MRRLSVLLCVLFLDWGGSACAAAGRGVELVRQMKRTGKPALILAGNESCVYCRLMARELATVREIQPLVRQFLVLKVDTDTAEWPAVRDALQFDGAGIPAVFVVRADGELIYSGSGKPSDLGAFLQTVLDKSGTILDPASLQAIGKAERDARLAIRRGDFAAAIPIVTKYEASGSYAEAALALDALHDDLVDKAGSALAAAEAELAADKNAVDAALRLVQLRRTLAGLPEAADSADAVWDRLAKDPAHAELLEQAKRLDQALERMDEREWKEAAATFRALIEEAPDSKASAFAKLKLAVVEKRLGRAGGADASKQTAASSVSDSRRAESFLRFAKVFLEKEDRAKAKRYLQRTIDAAPDSPAAEEARRLLGEWE